MDKKYVTIGTSNLSKDIFRSILRPANNFSLKPSGGLWASQYEEYTLSNWLYYLTNENTGLQAVKNIDVGVIFTLKENSNIIELDSRQKVKNLEEKYPSMHHILGYYQNRDNNLPIFDFEDLSKHYDGIYVNYYMLKYRDNIESFKEWSLNSLTLFNLDCIKDYQTIHISNTRYYDTYEVIPKIDYISKPKTIKEQSSLYIELYNYIKLIFNTLVDTKLPTNYDNYFTILMQKVDKCIKIVKENKKEEIKLLLNNLFKEDIQIKEDTVLLNIALNYLREYLDQNKNKEKNMSKTLIKNKKWYL